MSDKATIDVNDVPDDWMSFTVETKSGKLITVLRDEGIEPGDCDYYIMAKDIKEINRLINSWVGGAAINSSHVKKLVGMGLMKSNNEFI